MYKKGSITIFLLVYVDDMIVTSSASQLLMPFWLISRQILQSKILVLFTTSWEFKWKILLMSFSYLKKSTQLTCCARFVCLHVNLLPHQCPPPRNFLLMLVSRSAPKKPPNIIVWLSLFSIYLTPGLILPSLSTRFVNIWLPLRQFIGLQSSAFCAMLSILWALACIFGSLLHRLWVLFLTPIGWGVLMTVNQLVDMPYSLGLTLFPGALRSSPQCLAPAPRLSISLWLMLSLKLCGSNLFLRSCRSLLLQLLEFGVRIWGPSTSHLILFFMGVWNTMKLITTSSGIRLCNTSLMFSSSAPMINSQMASRSHYLNKGLVISVTIST
jgi:hypothetical protein